MSFMLPSFSVQAEEQSEAQQKALIQPQLKRIEFDESKINADDFEFMVAIGYLSIEDFGVNSLTVLKLSYYVNEDIFVQVAAGQSEGGQTSFEQLSGGAPLLTDSERELSYYSLNIGYNVLQGESFLNERKSFNSAFYVSAGIGNTTFAGDDRFTVNYGGGYRLLVNDSVATYIDFRNNVLDVDVFGEKKVTNNLEFTFGASLFF